MDGVRGTGHCLCLLWLYMLEVNYDTQMGKSILIGRLLLYFCWGIVRLPHFQNLGSFGIAMLCWTLIVFNSNFALGDMKSIFSTPSAFVNM